MIPLSGNYYRAIPKYRILGNGENSSSTQVIERSNPLDFEFMKDAGGRWYKSNRAGYVLYLSEDLPTCLEEWANSVRQNPIMKRLIWNIHELDVEIGDVVNFTDEAIRDREGIEKEDILGEDHSKCKQIGVKMRFERRAQGIYAPSARNQPDGKNLVVFPENQESSSHQFNRTSNMWDISDKLLGQHGVQ